MYFGCLFTEVPMCMRMSMSLVVNLMSNVRWGLSGWNTADWCSRKPLTCSRCSSYPCFKAAVFGFWFCCCFLLFGTAEEWCGGRLCTWHADMTNGWIFWKLPKSLLQSLCFCLLFSFCYVFFCRYCCCCFRLVWKCRRVMRRKSLTCRRRWRCHRQNATRALCVCGPRWKAPNPIRPFSLTLICC